VSPRATRVHFLTFTAVHVCSFEVHSTSRKVNADTVIFTRVHKSWVPGRMGDQTVCGSP